jgi:hypothetical protein
MTQVLLKADAIDVESQDERTTRRALVKEVNDVMKKLDVIGKP